jgi:diaminopimelate epimerase
MTISFTKMHGIGNDFIMIDAVTKTIDIDAIIDRTEALCDRHRGIGADGIIFLLPSTSADIKMRVINSDGSEPEMCGNGIRCFAKMVYDNGVINSENFTIETLAGPISPTLIVTNGKVEKVKVDMGAPILESAKIPVSGPERDHVINEEISINDGHFRFTGVSMGNPHAIVFVNDITPIDVYKLGPQFEHHPQFPARINTHFVEIHSASEATMKIWERGAGPTLACGTGACAVLVAGSLEGTLNRSATIHLPGGDLEIEWDSDTNHVFMTGAAQTVFTGSVSI